MNEAVSLQLAGLQAQVLWGTFDPNLTSRYDEIEQFLPMRIIQSNKSKTRDDWKKAIGNAHKVRMNVAKLNLHKAWSNNRNMATDLISLISTQAFQVLCMKH